MKREDVDKNRRGKLREGEWDKKKSSVHGYHKTGLATTVDFCVSLALAGSDTASLVLPFVEIFLAGHGAKVGVVLLGDIDVFGDEGLQLWTCQNKMAGSKRRGYAAYGKVGEVGNDIGADFGPVDAVASILGVSSHGAGAGTLVEALAGLLGGEGETAEGATQRSSGSEHGDGLCSAASQSGIAALQPRALGGVCGL